MQDAKYAELEKFMEACIFRAPEMIGEARYKATKQSFDRTRRPAALPDEADVDRVLSNLSLPKQTSRKTVKRQRHASTRRSAIRVDESTRGSTTRAINRDPRPHNESHQHQQRQRYVRRSTDRDVTQEATRDDMQRDDNE